MSSSEAFLEIKNLKTHFPVERGFLFKRHLGSVKAVDGVTLSLRQGEILGLVGESGCGKSTLGRTILQLVHPTEGTVVLDGRVLTHLRGKTLRQARSNFQMVFQDPFASLNPRMTVFDTLAEAMRAHREIPRGELAGRIAALLKKVGLSPRPSAAIRMNFPAGSASASPSPAPWPSNPNCLSPTNPSPPSTFPSRPKSSTCWPGFRAKCS